MIGAAWFQAILQALGGALAAFYSVVGNYGVAIILFTLAIRLVLVPLGIKQIKSMREMQAIQPKVKGLQQKYKGNRQKLNEETMKLYKEHGVNPLMGCLPLLAQFPILIALFAVLQFPKGITHIPHSNADHVVGQPQDSKLYVDILHQRTKFLGANLLCNAMQAGQKVKVDAQRYHTPDATLIQREGGLDCGSGAASRVPYYVFALLMIGTTFYQQRQMQQATPQGSQQQQALTKFMPLLFGFWGLIFPAGLVIYWTTTNLVQIGQQHFMLPRMQQTAPVKATGDGATSAGKGPGTRPRGSRPGEQRPRRPIAGQPEARNREEQGTAPGGTSATGSGSGSGGGGVRGAGGARRAGGSNGGSRKKRRKR